ncbi:hypothetical protein GW881_04330, partial [Candidatus Roizmanbacteria bacterium]|nr:hypothetical protein [Candidatus Roizmanbacteria bacterium]
MSLRGPRLSRKAGDEAIPLPIVIFMDWINQTLHWYFYLLILGMIFFPITSQFFPFTIDRGYAFAKTIAILIISYLVFIGGLTHVLPFQRTSIIGIMLLFAIVSLLITTIKVERKEEKKTKRHAKNVDFFYYHLRRGLRAMTPNFLALVCKKKDTFEHKDSQTVVDVNNKHTMLIFIVIEEILFIAALFFL